eukprot:6384835-Amphidinium_carterae.1
MAPKRVKGIGRGAGLAPVLPDVGYLRINSCCLIQPRKRTLQPQAPAPLAGNPEQITQNAMDR